MSSVVARRAPAAGRPSRPHPQPPRRAYLELSASVHRKLLNRLNLEALAQADRTRAESEIRTLLGQLLAEESTPLSLGERETLFAEVLDDVFGLGPLGAAAARPEISDILVNTYQQRLRRAGRRARARHRHVPGRRAPAARHRPHRQRRRPARRRQLADGRRAPGRRLARQRDHPAAGGRRPAAVDPPLSGRAAEGRRPGDAARADRSRCSTSCRTASARG